MALNLYSAISGLGDTLTDSVDRIKAPDLMREYQSALSGKPLPAEEPGMFARILKGENPFSGQPAPPQQPFDNGSGLPSITPMAQGGPSTRAQDEHESYIRQSALSRGIDPDTAVRVAQSEGLNSYTGDQGSSFGPFQLHYGGVAPGGNAVPGLGDEFTKATGLNARDPATWQRQVDFALDNASKGGWGPFHGAKNSGIGEFQGIGRGGSVQLAGPPPMPDTAPVNVQPGQAAPSGVPSIGSGAARTPMGQAMPGMSEELLMRMMRNPYTAQIAQAHLQQQIQAQYRAPPTSVQEFEYGQSHPGFAEAQQNKKRGELGPRVVGNALVDPTGKVLYKNENSSMSDETADFMADRVLAGDKGALMGLGRGAQGAENIAKIQSMVAQKAKAQGIDPSDILEKAAESAGLNAQQRTFGTQIARMATASTEAEGAISLGRQASDLLPRGTWVPVNKAIQLFQAGTSDPALKKFAVANMTIVNTYARAINPQGVPHVADKEKAESLLSTADGPEAYNAALDQLQDEINIAQQSPTKAQKTLQDIRKGKVVPKGQEGASTPAIQGGHDLKTLPMDVQKKAIERLRKNPTAQERKDFDEAFGPGAADRYIGPGASMAPRPEASMGLLAARG